MKRLNRTAGKSGMAFLVLVVCAVGLLQTKAAAAEPQETDKVQVVKDVAFLPEKLQEKMRENQPDMVRGRMDIYVPKGGAAEAKYPAVVVIHGGGWAIQTKREAVYVRACTQLATAGFVAASINYKLAPTASLGVCYLRNMASSFPANVQDCKSAVRFLRQNAAKYHVDPERIAVMGSSAGGHLAALTAVTQSKDGLEPTDDGLGDVSSAVQACVSYYGPHDWSKWGGKRGADSEDDIQKGKQASTLTYVDKSDPPMLVFHGNKDTTVPYTQSEILVARLKEVGATHEFVTLEGKGHGTFYTPAKSGIQDHEMVVKFLRRYLQDEPVNAGK